MCADPVQRRAHHPAFRDADVLQELHRDVYRMAQAKDEHEGFQSAPFHGSGGCKSLERPCRLCEEEV